MHLRHAAGAWRVGTHVHFRNFSSACPNPRPVLGPPWPAAPWHAVSWISVGGHGASAPLLPHGMQMRRPVVPQTEGTARRPSLLPPAPTARTAAPSLGSQGTASGGCLPHGQLRPPGVARAASLGTCLEHRCLCPSRALHWEPTALRGRDQPHFQAWKVRGHLAVRHSSGRASPLPSGLLTWTLLALSGHSHLGGGPLCPQVPTGQPEQGAQGG